jgi:hypothetical protein
MPKGRRIELVVVVLDGATRARPGARRANPTNRPVFSVRAGEELGPDPKKGGMRIDHDGSPGVRDQTSKKTMSSRTRIGSHSKKLALFLSFTHI